MTQQTQTDDFSHIALTCIATFYFDQKNYGSLTEKIQCEEGVSDRSEPGSDDGNIDGSSPPRLEY